MKNVDERNIILRAIIELKPQFEKIDGFVSKEWIIQKKNEKGFFKSLSNVWKRISDINDDGILYGFSEGILFTDKNIIFLNHEIYLRSGSFIKWDRLFSLPFEVPKKLKEKHNKNRPNNKINLKLPIYYSNIGGLKNEDTWGNHGELYQVKCKIDLSFVNELEFNGIWEESHFYFKLTTETLNILTVLQTKCKSVTIKDEIQVYKSSEDVFLKTPIDELESICKLVSDSLTWKYHDRTGGIRVNENDNWLGFSNEEGEIFKVTFNGENKECDIFYKDSDSNIKEIPENIRQIIIDYFKTGNKESVDRELSNKNSELIDKKSSWIKDFDKDGNGEVDTIEGDDFMKLFRKHQTVIKDFDKQYINHLVKVSNYLKTKRSNIQTIFEEIKKSKNQSQLSENVGLLKNQIHTYEVLNFHALSLITSIVEDDLITVNEIYEEFDKLKIFKSDHEKEVSQKLSEIGEGLNQLLISINSLERNIVRGLNQLSYLTQEGFSDLNKSVTRELESINSNMNLNNLLTGIQTYQMYKINENTKGLGE